MNKIKLRDTAVAKTLISNIMGGAREARVQKRNMVSVNKTDRGKTEITSIEGLQAWMGNICDTLEGPSQEAVKSQLQILNAVSSPVMTGMTVDRIIDSLNRSLNMAGSDEQKAAIRDNYASMIQNMFFFFEAKLHYAIDKNRDEAYQLLGQAAENLTECCSAMMDTLCGAEMPKTALFDKTSQMTKFFQPMASWARDRVVVKKKIEDYYTTIQGTFHMFDIYSDVIGPSILIHGMLSKYRGILVEARKDDLLGRASYGSLLRPKAVRDKEEGLMKMIFTKVEYIESEISEIEQELEKHTAELQALKKEYDELSLFQSSRKKEKAREMESVTALIEKRRQDLSRISEERKTLEKENPAVSIKHSLDEYEDELMRIESKYIFKSNPNIR